MSEGATRTCVAIKKDGRLGLGIASDLSIRTITEGGGAHEAGLQVGMRVIGVNGIEMTQREEYIRIVASTEGETPLAITVVEPLPLHKQLLLPWGCQLCNTLNKHRTLQCEFCQAENPYREEAEQKYRRMTNKIALGEVLSPVDNESYSVYLEIFDVPEDKACDKSVSPIRRKLSLFVSKVPLVQRKNIPTVQKASWSRADDNRLRELRAQEVKTEIESEELTELETQFQHFINEGLKQMAPTASGSTSNIREWTRDEDNRLRELQTKEKTEILNPDEQGELDHLTSRFDFFISDGLAQMRKPDSSTETTSTFSPLTPLTSIKSKMMSAASKVTSVARNAKDAVISGSGKNTLSS